MAKDNFEERLKKLDEMAGTIATIRMENFNLINAYRKVEQEIKEVKNKAEKEFGGEIVSEEVLEKKITEFMNNLELRNSAKPKSLQKKSKRLTGIMKLQVLIAMLHDFDEQGVDKVTLEDISDWTNLADRGEKKEILNDMGVGRVEVASTQFFQTKIKGNALRLYPDGAYESKSAPFKSYFDVKKWLKWLLDNQTNLESGKQGKGVKK
ncbi:MAG: hypothetical protein HOK57_02320 [Planctomycetaceae bacterium]|jgi:hypothetical protein|nr:hypothetical protein [Planctomycetaceae bacterium]MBT6643771.1 hypothetical protein [Planctomycetaceae bacterium]MBT7729259.1 hypothetical protein [Planctomycetaceae bacterium]|tara:strand:- start:6109 stop:6732 length:624 start_codon:yes stop_codon:yes gene_type:complete